MASRRRPRSSINGSYRWQKETLNATPLPTMGPDAMQQELPLFAEKPHLRLLPKPPASQVEDESFWLEAPF